VRVPRERTVVGSQEFGQKIPGILQPGKANGEYPGMELADIPKVDHVERASWVDNK